MAKAVLVMDMPEDCVMCKFLDSDNEECYAVGVDPFRVSLLGAKPDWCPLRELPEKANHPDYCDNGRFDKGWNACLEEIDPR